MKKMQRGYADVQGFRFILCTRWFAVKVWNVKDEDAVPSTIGLVMLCRLFFCVYLFIFLYPSAVP